MKTDTVRDIAPLEASELKITKAAVKQQGLRAIACLFMVASVALTAFTWKNITINNQIQELAAQSELLQEKISSAATRQEKLLLVNQFNEITEKIHKKARALNSISLHF